MHEIKTKFDPWSIADAVDANTEWPAVIYYAVPAGDRCCVIEPAGDGLYHWRFDNAAFELPEETEGAWELGESLSNEYWGQW
jgi:hypothetical protein